MSDDREFQHAFLDNYDEHDPVDDIPEVAMPCDFAEFETKQSGFELIPEAWKDRVVQAQPKVLVQCAFKHCGAMTRSNVLSD